MAPYVPEEVNVFIVPHSRMKELVNSYYELIQSANFSNTVDLDMLLESLYRTFTEFKSHEQIENKLIVRKLRSKMRMLSVNSAAVCNCHKGSRLSEMIRLLEDGFNKITDQDRINYGIKLQKELLDFTNDSFLPHMKEEEEVFQPLLLQYFSYEELCQLKQKVIQQHLAKKEAQRKGLEKSAWADCEPEGNLVSTSCSESDEEELKTSVRSENRQNVFVKLTILDLPPELILNVFQYLSPRELCRCAAVCHRLNRLAMDRALWKNILPVQWSRGKFSFIEAYYGDDSQDGSEDDGPADEDADVDESEDRIKKKADEQIFSESNTIDAVIAHLLPKVGLAVEKLVLANGQKITDQVVRKFLVLCPNVKHVDLTQTNITDAALVSFGRRGFASNLRTLILSGCPKITDASLIRLALCLQRAGGGSNCIEDFEDFSMSCWLLCDQYFEMCQSHIGTTSKDSTNEKNRPKQSCGRGPVEALHGGTVSVNRSRCISGLCGERKKPASCFSLDSCKPIKVQSENGYVRKRCLPSGGGGGVGGKVLEERNIRKPSGKSLMGQERALEFLDLSGCFRITDAGLSALFRSGHFPFLSFLDLSGCMRLTAVGLREAVSASPSLQPSNLFYCDNIIDGPYADEASGCRNLECSSRVCCRTGK